MLEVMRRVEVRVCKLEAVEGGFCLLERSCLRCRKRVRVRVLEAGQRRINLDSGPDSIHGCYGRQRVTEARGSGSIGASQVGQV